MSEVKVSMLAVGNVDQFEVTLESIGERLPFHKLLLSPCSISVSPDHFYEPLKLICDGQIMYGHITYSAEQGDIVTSPLRMQSFLEGLGYDVLLSPEFEECMKSDSKPLTKEQDLEKLAYEKEQAGVVY